MAVLYTLNVNQDTTIFVCLNDQSVYYTVREKVVRVDIDGYTRVFVDKYFLQSKSL